MNSDDYICYNSCKLLRSHCAFRTMSVFYTYLILILFYLFLCKQTNVKLFVFFYVLHKDINRLNSLLLRNFNTSRSSFNHGMCLYCYSWLNCLIDSNTGVFMYVILMRKATAIIEQESWSSEELITKTTTTLLFSFVYKDKIKILSDL